MTPMRGAVLRGVPDGSRTQVPVSNRRTRVANRAVACPACKAEVGEPCVSTATGEQCGTHIPRVRMANRKRNDAMGVNTTLHVEALTAAERRELRKGAGLTVRQLAQVLRCPEETITCAETGISLPRDLNTMRAYGALLLLWGSA